MSLRIHNTQTRRLEAFAPLQPGHVRMYVCGITVYDLCHLGHARMALAFDMVAENRAWFSELGSPMLALDLDVAPRQGDPHIELPPNVTVAHDWEERVRAAHAEGYAVVAGAIEWSG